MKYKYALFDWDGTIAQTLKLWLAVYQQVFREHDIVVTDRQVGASFGRLGDHLMLWGYDADESELQEKANVIIKDRLAKVELYEGARELLISLKEKGIKLALISTSPHRNLDPALRNNDLKSYFDVIVAGDDVSNHKPHPEPIEQALTKLGAAKSQSIIIGDSDKDLLVAQATEIDCIYFNPPEHSIYYDQQVLRSHHPKYETSKLIDILDIFEGNL
jgi:pyrophosphatase PpaX